MKIDEIREMESFLIDRFYPKGIPTYKELDRYFSRLFSFTLGLAAGMSLKEPMSIEEFSKQFTEEDKKKAREANSKVK